MAETLEVWLKRQLIEVAENGSSTQTIRLTAGDGGATWERWEAPFLEKDGGPGPAALAQTIEDVIGGFAEEWPVKQTVQVMLIAEDSKGLDRARRLQSVRGRHQSATGAHLTSESVAQATAMGMVAETTKSLLGAGNSQISLLVRQNEKQAEQINMLVEMMINMKMEKAYEAEESKDVMGDLISKLAENSGPVLEMIAQNLSKKGPVGV